MQVLRPCKIRPIAFILRSGYCSGRVANRTASDLRSESPHWINAGEFPVDRNSSDSTLCFQNFWTSSLLKSIPHDKKQKIRQHLSSEGVSCEGKAEAISRWPRAVARTQDKCDWANLVFAAREAGIRGLFTSYIQGCPNTIFARRHLTLTTMKLKNRV